MAKGFTFTKADLAKAKSREANMSPAKRRVANKALVTANSEANGTKRKKKA